ncbi:site-specific integrase [Elizabethkingia anophelis]|uniref:site-specific integrase n=1 Tax=Elizabethkingia anophelis TaxID=1117645 RepID=UPI001369CE4A|nr:site-specific integrase [Elizabethkingia anophelis]MYY44015.1 site-specific integrase [Elizabethkingia anophelis]
MLENSYGLTFFLKSPKNKKTPTRSVYVRVTVDGVPKETSTKRKWQYDRWDDKLDRASGTKEDAKSLNHYLDSLETKINNYKTMLVNEGKIITSEEIINYVKGKTISRAKVLEEFQKHNDEMYALVPKEFAEGTWKRYVTARSHVHEFIKFKYRKEDLEFRELNYEFVKDYEFYLKTVRKCANNTTLKYISNFKKIVLRAVALEIIPKDPFVLFKGKKTKIKKRPLTKAELYRIESKVFNSERLTTIRDIFIFQCYTGLAYIDAYRLKNTDIKQGNDGQIWIMSNRQKTDSVTDIPLLPQAIEIINKYKDHPICLNRGSVLPVKSNQRMNEYLKEIAVLCDINEQLNTHKARRTFASTVALANGVPIHIVKALLGHYSVTQTEDYAITDQESISREMNVLKERLTSVKEENTNNEHFILLLKRLENELDNLKHESIANASTAFQCKLNQFEKSLNTLKSTFK